MRVTREIMDMIREWTPRLEGIGPQLERLRDEPESFTREETLAILEETDKVFAAFRLIQFHLGLQSAPDSLQ
jgi:hypothetical protein